MACSFNQIDGSSSHALPTGGGWQFGKRFNTRQVRPRLNYDAEIAVGDLAIGLSDSAPPSRSCAGTAIAFVAPDNFPAASRQQKTHLAVGSRDDPTAISAVGVISLSASKGDSMP
jgi:hypothetical protein